MPRTPSDYSKTIIYKIVCNDINVTDTYTGHTTDFSKRKYHHKSKCSDENGKLYNLKLYKTIRENGGFENWSMIEIEKYPCKDHNEARARERYHYEILQSKLNTVRPYLSTDDKKEYDVEYYINNRDKMLETQKRLYENNKDKIINYQHEYRMKNIEKIKQQKTEYRLRTQEHIKQKQSQKYTCECGTCLTLCKKTRHNESIKHQDYLKSVEKQIN